MGQAEIIKILKKNVRPLTSTEIAAQANINARSVRRILHSLRKDSSTKLKFKRLSSIQKQKRYGKNVNSKRIGVYFLK